MAKYTREQIEGKLTKVFDSTLQTKNVKLKKDATITPDEGYLGLKSVNITVIGGGNSGGNDNPGTDKKLERNDVNFFDYDGTLLYAYTWEEALELTELPEGPEHEGLVFQEWNYTLEDIWEQGSVEIRGYADVGANYVTNDGKTRYYINNPIPTLVYSVYCNSNAIINWGDGETSSHIASTSNPTQHIYNATGNFIIEVEQSEVSPLIVMNSDSYWGGYGYNIDVFDKIEYGDKVNTFMGWGWGYNYLQVIPEVISIPTTMVYFNSDYNSTQPYGIRTKCFVLPKTINGDSSFVRLNFSKNNCNNCTLSIPNLHMDVQYNYLGIKGDRLVIPKGMNLYGSSYVTFDLDLKELIINSEYVTCEGWRGLVETFRFNGREINISSRPYNFACSKAIFTSNAQRLSSIFTSLGEADFTESKVIPQFSNGASLVWSDDIANYNCSYTTIVSPEYYNQWRTRLSGFNINYRIDYSKMLKFDFEDDNSFCCPLGYTWREFINSPYNGELSTSYDAITAGYGIIKENPDNPGQLLCLEHVNWGSKDYDEIFTYSINNVNIDDYVLPGKYYGTYLGSQRIESFD